MGPDTCGLSGASRPEFLDAINGVGAPGLFELLGRAPGLGFPGGQSWEERMLDGLAEAVGGRDALAGLDTSPLPDEPFDWDRIPQDVRDRVADVLGLVDAYCDEHLDVECRTAGRRLLADVAVGDPEIFRRKGRPDTAAAAICWLMAKANDLFGYRSPIPTVKELLAAFGVAGSVSSRANTMLKALSVRPQLHVVYRLGTTRYLIGRRRRAIIDQRDALEALDEE